MEVFAGQRGLFARSLNLALLGRFLFQEGKAADAVVKDIEKVLEELMDKGHGASVDTFAEPARMGMITFGSASTTRILFQKKAEERYTDIVGDMFSKSKLTHKEREDDKTKSDTTSFTSSVKRL